MKPINKLCMSAMLLCWASMALAGEPIPGVPIGLEGDPGSVKFDTKTDANGNFSFRGLPPGKYRLSTPGQPSQTVIITKDGTLKGQLKSSVNNGASKSKQGISDQGATGGLIAY